jgi:hypothetical protein
MILSEEQYERIARWLDGEEIRLTAEEREAVSDLHRSRAVVAPALDVEVPREAMARAERRLRAALAHPRRRLLRIGALAGGAAAAAAAAIVIAISALHTLPPGGDADGVAKVPLEVFVAAMQESETEKEMLLLAREMDDLEAEWAALAPIAQADDMDEELELLRQEIGQLLLSEPLGEEPGSG